MLPRPMRRELRWKRTGLYRLFFFLVLLPSFCVFPYLRAVNNPNEFTRVFTVMALVENHTFAVDEQVQTWGWVNDMAKVRGKDGRDHHFMVKGPGAVYLGLPGYFLFTKLVAPILGHHYVGIPPQGTRATHPVYNTTQEEKLWWLRMATWSMRLFGSQLPCFLFLLWFERYLRAFTPDAMIRYAAVAACGLGTNYLAYVNMFASHSQYAVAAFLAFALIERERRLARGEPSRMRTGKAFLAGFFTSACVVLEYHALFMTVVMSLFAVFTFWNPIAGVRALLARRRRPESPKRLLAFAGGGLLNVPHMMYFHWTAYGNPFTPGHQQLESAQFATEHKTGLWGILWPSWEHIRALATDPGFGFFGMSPFMWLGLLSVPVLLLAPTGGTSRRAHLRVISVVWLALMSVVFGINAGFIEWRAGWTVGPRYLVVCAPFFAFGGALLLERFSGRSRSRRAIARGVGGGLALAGVVSIGTVSIIYDTLPETIARPFAQFSIPFARTGFVAHHVGEWFGRSSTTFWYVVCAAMLLAPTVAGLWPPPEERTPQTLERVLCFVLAFVVGMVPAFTTPLDGTRLMVAHPSVAGFTGGWEPAGRDRLTLLREEAERYGPRGKGPCLYWNLAELERVVGQDVAAAKDEVKARLIPREQCPKLRY